MTATRHSRSMSFKRHCEFQDPNMLENVIQNCVYFEKKRNGGEPTEKPPEMAGDGFSLLTSAECEVDALTERFNSHIANAN